MLSPKPAAPPSPARPTALAALFTALVAVTLMAAPASAQTWNESGDAGDLPASAQATTGVGPLTTINGSLASAQDVDMYCIRVVDPPTFVARLQCVVIQGPDIWLFNSAGQGVSANFLCQAGDKRVSGTFATTAGLYYVAVSYRGVAPDAAAGAIWLPGNTAEHAPDGSGAGGVVVGWSGTGNVQPLNPYRIVLTGAEFCDAATPARRSAWGTLKLLYR
jgi:hypothetical protein